MSLMRRMSLLLLVAFTLIAAGCSSSDSGDGSEVAEVAASSATDGDAEEDSPTDGAAAETAEVESESGPTEAEATSSDEPADASSDSDDPAMNADSPLGEFFAADGGFQSALQEYTIRVEEEIVVCMAEQGFEFARSENNTANPVQEQQSELTLREWTSRYGYGISTSFESVTTNLTTNPNFEIFTSLSPGERDAWAFTLNGVGVDALLGGGGPVENSLPLEEQGCIGQALIETGGQDALEGLDEFGDVYGEGEAALFERREMVDAVDGWTRCMSENGYPGLATLDDPENGIGERFGVITAPLAGAGNLTDEEGQALLDGDSIDLEQIEGLDVEALRALQDEEIATALVDLDCYEAEVQEIYEPLRDEFEQGLLVDYATELEALRTIGS